MFIINIHSRIMKNLQNNRWVYSETVQSETNKYCCLTVPFINNLIYIENNCI